MPPNSESVASDLLKLDLYEVLSISCDANEKEIKQAFRKKALACHPDKNPDDPNAAEQFNQLKKILEILLDPGAKSAYDKVLNGRKAAALRALESGLKQQKLKSELEERERQSNQKLSISEEERLKREIKRLEEEGRKVIEEELEILNKEARNQSKSCGLARNAGEQSPSCRRVKAKWRSNDDWRGFTKEEVERLFFKWGEISAVVMNEKGTKKTALIEYQNEDAADMAVKFEKGLPGKEIEVSLCTRSLEDSKKKKKAKKDKQKTYSDTISSRDFESISDMNDRRKQERQALIDQMLRNESL